jgi:hypothetical protein
VPGSLQSKGDGEYPYSAPFGGLNVSLPSILLPPNAQDAQVSPSFSIVRGSICAPWPYAQTLFGSSLSAGEYFLFATPSGYIVTNLKIYQMQQSPGNWFLQTVATMPSGAFPSTPNQLPAAFVEANGCLYFSCLLGIYRFSPSNGLMAWSVAFSANYLTISNQRMIAVGTNAVTGVTPGNPAASSGTGSLPAGTYYAVVTAVFPSGTEGPPSAEGSFTLSSPGGIVWAWTAVSGASSYNIYIGTGPNAENTVANVSTNTYALTSYTAGTVSPPSMPPNTPWTIAWSTVSTFSSTSVGSFNSNTNTNSGVVGGYDVLTSYSQGFPVGIVNLGHSFYVQMTQGIVEVDPAQNGTSAFTLYNYWQATLPVGALPGTVAQYGPITAFVTPDNVNLWVPGSQQQIGTPVMPLIRNIYRNAQYQVLSGIPVSPPLTQNPPVNASFAVVYGELHYLLAFNIYGVPEQQASNPYPNQIGNPQWFGLILDYNFASQSWSQQQTPPLTTPVYQVTGPPLTTTSPPQMPQQSLLIAGTQANPSSAPGWIVFGTDVFNQLAWNGVQCQALMSQPQPCKVGFPQTPISSGHRPANRRVRIEYSMDEFSCATGGAPIDLTVSIQGTITQNVAAVNSSNASFQSNLYSYSTTIQIMPLGVVAETAGQPIVPFLTSTAYADIVISCENPQISLSWTDPSSHQRLMIHRVTLQTNDTKGVMQ